jgi:hypothetical protein
MRLSDIYPTLDGFSLDTFTLGRRRPLGWRGDTWTRANQDGSHSYLARAWQVGSLLVHRGIRYEHAADALRDAVRHSSG